MEHSVDLRAPAKRVSAGLPGDCLGVREFSFSRARVLQVCAIVVLVIVGVALPYLTMVWQNPASEIVVFRGSLNPSANLVGGLEPLDLPNSSPGEKAQRIVFALNVIAAGPSLHQIGAVVPIITVACSFQTRSTSSLVAVTSVRLAACRWIHSAPSWSGIAFARRG